MAEYVQQNLEGMLPELEELERLGVFSSDEIRTIVRKRREYEYRLQKRIVQKSDFLRYMQYEINLDMLKKKRKSRLGIRRNLQAEHAAMKKIHTLFQEPFMPTVVLGDKCSVAQLTELGKSTCIHTYLWIMAAKWEFEENKNIPNCRSLLQRGLRVNSSSQQLWLEYFRMELLHVEKIHNRRKVLGMSREEGDDAQDEEVTAEFLAGKVPEIVYKKAIEAVPDDINFRVSFIEIYRLFENTEHGCDIIYDSLMKDFPQSEEVWNLKARRPIDDAKAKVKKGTTVITESQWSEFLVEMNKLFYQAVEQVPTEKMWELYITTCMELLTDSFLEQAKGQQERNVLHLFSEAEKAKCLSEDLYKTWVDLLLQTDQPKKALLVCKKGTKQFETSVSLWSEHLRLKVLNKGKIKDIQKEFSTAVQCISSKDSIHLWNLWIEWCIKNNPDEVESVFELSLQSCVDVQIQMKNKYVEWTSSKKGIKKARKLYKRLIEERPYTISFFRKCIDLELMQVEPSAKRVRDLYEAAVDHFGSSHPELWLDYIRLELLHPGGKPDNVGQLYWRATKTLGGKFTEEFVGLYSLLQAGRV
ncbi:U3 small nucleolar RNA-associated protein 6-like [Stylophora pistillata]|uniref:U3 small nucleolar RNA-associated protein 6-like n=1 Tax=Stylophora pistillata TaxID=50429 RepID=A0A2B4RSS2_STYPI|nr:U3 small nucleolar RNA-associated protein 6-like [Stylophora pistillata]